MRLGAPTRQCPSTSFNAIPMQFLLLGKFRWMQVQVRKTLQVGGCQFPIPTLGSELHEGPMQSISCDLDYFGVVEVELVINLKTAMVLGLDVPPTVPARADKATDQSKSQFPRVSKSAHLIDPVWPNN
jgi:hypothetical protein